ncbi:hypothetical protein BDW02DRAFT_545349 [Decorospora gaudefroyi]|uniref:N-acetyltransferase domain-containing protein n=1 Tax=Decorospora gaudefroyi TaxID=184978 RepID=A0A6A5KQU7_9PLEO|nr:hypothetical protein BDW02DRAFT_545349 [Decorospora gaudefroyi]
MPLQIQPITSSADFSRFVEIHLESFASGGGITSLLTPSPLPDDYIPKMIDKHIKSWREEPDVTYLKIIDTDLDGKMIAGAKWRVNTKERTEQEIQSMLPVPGKDEEGRQGVIDFMHFLHRVRKQYMGTKPFCFLHILVTDPQHHRRGAGAMALRWGFNKADEVQLPCFLESSPMGKPLYERMGFKVQEVVTWDLTKYGLEGEDTSTVMLREPVLRVPVQ